MFLGAQYHRPPNPPRDDWDRDMRLMVESGLGVVRTWLYWNAVNHAPDLWVWEEYDALFEAARRNGLKVLVQFMLDSPPAWVVEEHPETLYVDARGARVELGSHQAQQVGGAPGQCFHVEASRSGAEEYMRRVVERYRGHEALLAWDVWNEIWIVDCHCPATQAIFRKWLLARYGSVEGINRAWRTYFRDIAEVRIPKRAVYAPLLDLARFRRWVRADSMRWRSDFVRSLDEAHPVVSHGGRYSAEIDPWALTDTLDGWGLSCYRHDFHEISLDLDTTLSASKGKTWWLSEQPGGYVWHDSSGHGGRSPAQIRSLTLFALGKGAKGALFWQWRPELFGQESPYYGVTTVDGQPTPRSEAVGEIGAMLQRHRELFEQLKPTRPEVGLVIDLDTLAYERSVTMQDVWFAGGKAATPWSEHAFGVYRALLDRGYGVRVLDASELATAGVPAGLKVLVLPLQVVEQPGLVGRLGEWVDAGGTLVAGPLCGLYGPDTFTSRPQPPLSVQTLFGVAQDGDVRFGVSPTVELAYSETLGVGGELLPGQYLLQPLCPSTGTEVMGVCGNSVALTAARRGQGLSVMVGSLVGGQYDRVDRPGLASLLDAVCQRAGIVLGVRATGGVLAQPASSGSRELLFIHNPLTKGADTWVSLAERTSGTVRDLLTETVVAEVMPDRPFHLSLGPQDSRVLLIGGGD